MTTTVRSLTWDEAMRDLADAWSALTGTHEFNPSLDPRWVDLSVRSQHLAGSLLVGAIFDGTTLLGATPMSKSRVWRRGIPARRVDFGTQLVAYHRELVTRAADVDEITNLLESCLRGRWDIAQINDVPAGSPTAAAVERLSHRLGCRLLEIPGERSPYIHITSDWPTYLRSRTKKFRANVTRALRRPAEIGAAEMRWFEQDADTTQLLADMLVVEKSSWKSAEGVAISDREFEMKYHRLLLPYLARHNMLLANVLYVEGRPGAYVLCCRTNRWIGQLKTSFDSRLKDAGAAVFTSSVMRAFELGASEYDFLGHADAHKLKWSTNIREHRGFLLIADTALGRVHRLVQTVIDRLRPTPARRAEPSNTEGQDD